MNRTSLRRAAVPSVAVLALGLSLTACGAGNEQPLVQRRSSRRRQQPQRHPQRRRLQRPGGRPGRLDAPASRPPTPASPSTTTRSAPAPAASSSSPAASTSPAPTPTSTTSELAAVQGALRRRRRHRGPGLRQPDRGGLQPRRASTSSSCRPTPLAQIFAGKITKWNDPAIAADNPDADAARHDDHAGAPLGRLGHHRELHRLPAQGRRRRLDRRRGRRRLADQVRRGRRGHLRRHRGGQGRRGHHRLRRREPGRRPRRRHASRSARSTSPRPPRPPPRPSTSPSASRAAPPTTSPSTSTARRPSPGAYPLVLVVLRDRLPDVRRRERPPTWSRATCPTSVGSRRPGRRRQGGRLRAAVQHAAATRPPSIVDDHQGRLIHSGTALGGPRHRQSPAARTPTSVRPAQHPTRRRSES